MTKYKALLLFSLLFAQVMLASCSNDARERERVAVVNGAPIYLDEFHREIAIASEMDPAFSVNSGSLKATLEKMVEKRLLIHEAQKKGITQDERFISAIKTLWEQTLIQRLMEQKSEELSAGIFVTDSEVKRHYDRMGYRVTMKIKGPVGESEAEEAKKGFEAGEKVPGAETIGPVLLEEMQAGSPLEGAFDLEVGSAGVFADPSAGPSSFIAAFVVGRDRVPVRPMAELSRHIRAELLEKKKAGALSEWLEGVKAGASVQIDGKLLERIADE